MPGPETEKPKGSRPMLITAQRGVFLDERAHPCAPPTNSVCYAGPLRHGIVRVCQKTLVPCVINADQWGSLLKLLKQSQRACGSRLKAKPEGMLLKL
eukprot:1157727-Pelagomonas_calceolata.AAC.5